MEERRGDSRESPFHVGGENSNRYHRSDPLANAAKGHDRRSNFVLKARSLDDVTPIGVGYRSA